MIQTRPATGLDLDGLYRIAAAMGAAHEARYFERCLLEQQEGRREIFVAIEGLKPVGYVQLVWQPLYPPFRRLGIPEIQDLNVMPDVQRRGIGSMLADVCEARAREVGKTDVGISVGLTSSYGAAQRLYIRKGYMPDGAGMCCDEVPVRAGDMRPADDLLTLKLLKAL